MKTIIFSMNRAPQLQLLLESIRENDAYNLFDDIVVLYRALSDDFERGYQRTKKEFPEVEFRQQISFKLDLLQLLETKEEFVTFFVDDIIVYRRLPFNAEMLQDLFASVGDSLACVSLRVGQNTKHLYQHDNPMIMPKFVQEGSFLIWNRHSCTPMQNFNYPFSLDGHIFRTKDIHGCVHLSWFCNPNELESVLQLEYAHMMPPLMACCFQSIIVNNPVNRVQNQYKNKFGTIFSNALEELNNDYLHGKKIDLEAFDFSNIIGSHQELEVHIV